MSGNKFIGGRNAQIIGRFIRNGNIGNLIYLVRNRSALLCVKMKQTGYIGAPR